MARRLPGTFNKCRRVSPSVAALHRKAKGEASDGSGELEAASKELKFPHDLSTPQRPQNNGIAERAVRRVIEGTRCCLLQAGLCHAWWREAMRAYCYNRNISDVVLDGKTPYELRFEQPFGGKLLPFGCSVEYKPESERETNKLHKFGSKLRPGIFMGHHSHNGGKWSGDYYVVDAEAFAGSLTLSVRTSTVLRKLCTTAK